MVKFRPRVPKGLLIAIGLLEYWQLNFKAEIDILLLPELQPKRKTVRIATKSFIKLLFIINI